MKNCQNCIHFFQTAMAQTMGGGEFGYCLLIQNDHNIDLVKTESGISKAKPSAFRRKVDSCDHFEKPPIILKKRLIK